MALRKLKKVNDEPKQSREVDNTVGSHLWSYNYFRTSILTSLLNDLIDLENTGIDESICKEVRRALDYYINASTNVPSGGFLSGGPLYKEIEGFADTYKHWNDIHGRQPENIQQRRVLLRELRKRRQEITDKVRRLQFELYNNLDQQILADSYNAIGSIIKLVPDIFRNLTSSYSNYTKKSIATAN